MSEANVKQAFRNTDFTGDPVELVIQGLRKAVAGYANGGTMEGVLKRLHYLDEDLKLTDQGLDFIIETLGSKDLLVAVVNRLEYHNVLADRSHKTTLVINQVDAALKKFKKFA